MDLVALFTTFGRCSLSFCEEDCLALVLAVAVDDPNRDSNGSSTVAARVCVDGLVENISSVFVGRDTIGLLAGLLNRDSNGSADGLGGALGGSATVESDTRAVVVVCID